MVIRFFRLEGPLCKVAFAVTCACDNTGESTDVAKGPSSRPAPAAAPESAPLPVTVPDLSTPKSSMQAQYDLLVSGNVETLRECFIDRQKAKITEENVELGRKAAGKMSFADIYAEEIPGEFEGIKTMKIKMKSGRTLTTLNLVNGKWLAATVWFK